MATFVILALGSAAKEERPVSMATVPAAVALKNSRRFMTGLRGRRQGEVDTGDRLPEMNGQVEQRGLVGRAESSRPTSPHCGPRPSSLLLDRLGPPYEIRCDGGLTVLRQWHLGVVEHLVQGRLRRARGHVPARPFI